MNREKLVNEIRKKKSYLCVGLDTDARKIPPKLANSPDAVFSFNKAIIDATKDLCVAYKLNTAFYEAAGLKGWEALEKTVDYIGDDHLRIADAKRGDIGNTSSLYARAFFEELKFDAITVAPYMGADSIMPFLEYADKWTIVLGLTSNAGSGDFQQQSLNSGKKLYEYVLETVSGWAGPQNLMFVIGATQSAEFRKVREIIPEHFLLVPGVGAQGGSLREISENAMNNDVGLLVNASRAIIYASPGNDFDYKAREAAEGYCREMKEFLPI